VQGVRQSARGAKGPVFPLEERGAKSRGDQT
jgi:hypothetical protein